MTERTEFLHAFHSCYNNNNNIITIVISTDLSKARLYQHIHTEIKRYMQTLHCRAISQLTYKP